MYRSPTHRSIRHSACRINDRYIYVGLSTALRIVILFVLVALEARSDEPSAVVPSTSDPAGLALPSMWEYSRPLISPESRDDEPSFAQKDPTIVFHEGRWHVFMTVKLPRRSAIEFCSFTEWEDANAAPRHRLQLTDSDYFCAPQVFYYRPHRLWYLVYQVGIPGQDKMWVAFSTTKTIDDPKSWTKARPMLDGGPNDGRVVGGLDYWIICDDHHAWLFFTSLNGKLWRMKTSRAKFPYGFEDCQLALESDIFEASHTYRVESADLYLTIVEQKGRRYFKAFVADRLDGPWRSVRDSEQKPFAGFYNVRPAHGVEPWTDNISHGELVRTSNDERLLINGHDLKLVFQGLLEKDKKGKPYGRLNWRIGLLTPAK